MNATTKAEADVMEVWLPISGYAGLYSVSNLGRIRSEPKNVIRCNGVVCPMPQKIRRPALGANGYLSLGLVNASGVLRTHYVHTLVLVHFDAPRPDICTQQKTMLITHKAMDASETAHGRWKSRTSDEPRNT